MAWSKSRPFESRNWTSRSFLGAFANENPALLTEIMEKDPARYERMVKDYQTKKASNK